MTRHLRACGAVILLLFATGQAAAAELVISKGKRSLEYRNGSESRTFPISLGFTPIGPKRQQGDGKTPEGVYYIAHRNPNSSFYLSLGISYPNLADAKEALRDGLISKTEFAAIERANRLKRMPPQNTRMGGAIYIHGGGTGSDWTWGCVALSNQDMAFLFQHLNTGDKVTILE